MNLHDAIFVRKSSRDYIMEELDPVLLENLIKYTGFASLLQEEYKVRFKILNNVAADNESLSNLSVKAPYYLLIASDEKDGHWLNVGYVMEQISLYLTTKGIGSCFLGLPRHKRTKLANMDYPVSFVMAFGKTKGNVYRDQKKAKRFGENFLCSIKADLPNSIKSMLKAARLAPSTLNSQPWRFVAYDNRIHIFARKDFMSNHIFRNQRDISMGIMLSHMMLTSEELWVDISIETQDSIAEKEFKKNEYITSVLIKRTF